MVTDGLNKENTSLSWLFLGGFGGQLICSAGGTTDGCISARGSAPRRSSIYSATAANSGRHRHLPFYSNAAAAAVLHVQLLYTVWYLVALSQYLVFHVHGLLEYCELLFFGLNMKHFGDGCHFVGICLIKKLCEHRSPDIEKARVSSI